MQRIVLGIGVTCAFVAATGCAPYSYRLPPERQADTRAEYTTPAFTVRPPPGRWTVDTIPADSVKVGWPPRMRFRSMPRNCPLSFTGDRTGGDVTCFIDRFVARALPGYVFCKAPATQISIDEPPDTVTACMLVRTYELQAPFRGADGNRAAVAELAKTLSAMTEASYNARIGFWESLSTHERGPRRGALRELRIGTLTFHRVVTVDVADTTRIVSGFLDEQLLLHFMPEQVLVIALSLEAEPLAPKREEWMVLESLRWDPLESTCRHASLSIL